MTANVTLAPFAILQFCDDNGAPLVSGSVGFYQVNNPATLGTVWGDVAGTLVLQNPVPLDAAGRPQNGTSETQIYGTGAYLMVVRDQNGNLITQGQIQVGLGVQVSAAMTPVVEASTTAAALALLDGFNLGADNTATGDNLFTGTNTFQGKVSGGEFDVQGTEQIVWTPVTNALQTVSSWVMQATTTSSTIREYVVGIDVISDQGSGAGGNAGDKVALYSGIDVRAGSGDAWSFNTVLTMDSGSGTNNNQGYELDFNNNNAARGTGVAGAGFAAPIAVGLSITGDGAFSSTAAAVVSGPGTQIWQRGFAVTNTSVAQASFQDLGNATRSVDIYGTHLYGLDMANASFSSDFGIRVGNTTGIGSLNAAGNADLRLIELDNSNNLILGSLGATPGMFINAATNPAVDNSYALGGNANRWSVVWAANGTIQTSDPSLKTEISPIPAGHGLELVKSINPVTFKWKIGGVDVVEGAGPKVSRPKMERVEWEEEVPTRQGDGTFRLETVKKSSLEPVYDEVPVLDASGAQVVKIIPARLAQPEVLDEEGKLIKLAQPARPEVRVPLVHRVLQMEEVATPGQVPREGKRLHWGFLAPEVKAAFDKIGLDFGGWVKSEDGVEHLRPDQLLSVLWKAVQELVVEVEGLKVAKSGAPS